MICYISVIVGSAWACLMTQVPKRPKDDDYKFIVYTSLTALMRHWSSGICGMGRLLGFRMKIPLCFLAGLARILYLYNQGGCFAACNVSIGFCYLSHWSVVRSRVTTRVSRLLVKCYTVYSIVILLRLSVVTMPYPAIDLTQAGLGQIHISLEPRKALVRQHPSASRQPELLVHP